MSVAAREVSDRLALYLAPMARAVYSSPAGYDRALARRLESYGRDHAHHDIRFLLSEARRLAEDLRHRVGADATDPEWQEIDHRERIAYSNGALRGYGLRCARIDIQTLTTAIERMEDQLLLTAPRASASLATAV